MKHYLHSGDEIAAGREEMQNYKKRQLEFLYATDRVLLSINTLLRQRDAVIDEPLVNRGLPTVLLGWREKQLKRKATEVTIPTKYLVKTLTRLKEQLTSQIDEIDSTIRESRNHTVETSRAYLEYTKEEVEKELKPTMETLMSEYELFDDYTSITIDPIIRSAQKLKALAAIPVKTQLIELFHIDTLIPTMEETPYGLKKVETKNR